MIYNINSITQACFLTYEEVQNGVYKYSISIDPKTLIDNSIYQFGNIYDSIRDVYLYFTDDSRGVYNLPYDAGYGLGYAIYLVFKSK